jgi:hypothetical protein
MKNYIKVKAKQGTKCPTEKNARAYITDTKAVDVPDTAYYRRLVNDGSLITVSKQTKPAKEIKDNGK